jgi:hypothetical protein
MRADCAEYELCLTVLYYKRSLLMMQAIDLPGSVVNLLEKLGLPLGLICICGNSHISLVAYV